MRDVRRVGCGIAVMVCLLMFPQTLWAGNGGRVVVFGLDETGSYSFREKALSIARNIIGDLQPGDVFYLRRITDRSYHDSSSVFRLQVPAVMDEPQNRFDPRARKEWLRSRQKSAQAKTRAQTVLASLKVVDAPRTDIWGFFAAAADRFQVEGDGRQRLVIIASDLRHNCGVKPQIDLSGCEVHVVGFETGRNPVEIQQVRAGWAKELKGCNAAAVSFHPVDYAFNLKP